MSKLSAKHQVTIPIDIIRAADLKPGDTLEWAIYQGQITAFKKSVGAAAGILKHVVANDDVTEDESRQSVVNDRH